MKAENLKTIRITFFAGCSKDLIGETRDNRSGGVRVRYVDARRFSATKPMSLFSGLLIRFRHAQDMLSKIREHQVVAHRRDCQ